MKIFLGGVKPVQRDAFAFLHPDVEFLFVAEDDTPGEWRRAAIKAQHHIVFQHRTTHRHTQTLQGIGCRTLFTDSVPIAHQLIVEIVKNGKASHHYTGAARS